jgi:NAD(P)H-hydrate epimerase
VRGDARLHMGVLERSGGAIVEVPDEAAWAKVRERILAADVVVDAILGTGLHQAPSGIAGRAVSELSGASAPAVLAVDVPSGVPSDSGEVAWESVRAALTVTFAAPKYGHLLPPACDRVGRLIVADIGIPRSFLSNASVWLLEPADAGSAWGTREPGSHKGSYGHVLVIAGSTGKTGAAVLTGTAALRAGAGLVTVATPAPALPLVAGARAELMTEPLPAGPTGAVNAEAVERALALAASRDAVVLGPGLSQEPGTREFVREVVRRCPVPLLVDADGLNALAASTRPAVEAAVSALRRSAPTVVTPHPGEMARLAGSSTAEVQRRRLETARSFALQTGAVVVLKGHRTVVADPDGRAAINPTGNPGMATGGTGDVLAGVIGALLARGREAWTAAAAGVYAHGLAGDVAASRRGPESLLAGDVVAALSRAIRSLATPGTSTRGRSSAAS